MYVTQIYCENPECNVREIEIRTKDFDQPDPETWYCPACRKRAKIHWRRTGQEHAAQEEALRAPGDWLGISGPVSCLGTEKPKFTVLPPKEAF